MPTTARAKTREKENIAFDIIINGSPYRVTGGLISFDEIVDCAYPEGDHGPLVKFTVNFYNGGGRPLQGKVSNRRRIRIKDGTVFNVTRTDRS